MAAAERTAAKGARPSQHLGAGLSRESDRAMSRPPATGIPKRGAHSLCGALVRADVGEVGDKVGEAVRLVDHRKCSRVLDHFQPTIG
jgi:hypothetical protein